MSYRQPPINVPISVSNATNEPIEFKIREEFPQGVVSKADDYVFAVTRVKIPSQTIETFVIPDENIPQYYISMIAPTQANKKIYWPNSAGVLRRNTTDEYVGTQKHFSPTDILNTINYMYMNSLNQIMFDANHYVNWTKTDFTFAGGAATYNSGNNAFSFPSGRKLSHVELVIENFVASKTGGGALDDVLVIKVNAPGSKSYRALIVYEPDNLDWNNTNANLHLVISDRGFRQLGNQVERGISSGNLVYLPSQTSLEFLDSIVDPNGNWFVTVTSMGGTNFTGSMSFKLRVFYSLNNDPYKPLAFGIDSNKVSVNYQDEYAERGYRICVSPKINTMINFQPFAFYSNDVESWVLELPQFPTDTTHTLTQNRSSLSQMSNLDRIAIYGNDLPLAIDGEVLNNNISTQIVTDFVITETIDDFGSDYVYILESEPWRYYVLTDNRELKKLNLDVRAIYNNDIEQTIYINPGDNANIRCSFLPKNQVY